MNICAFFCVEDPDSSMYLHGKISKAVIFSTINASFCKSPYVEMDSGVDKGCQIKKRFVLKSFRLNYRHFKQWW